MKRAFFFASLALLMAGATTGCSNDRARGPGIDGGADTGTMFPDGGGPDGGGVDSGGGGDASVVDSPLVDPSCVDGMYSETLPNATAPIDDLIASYEPPAFSAFIDGILDRRYPIGAALVRGGRMSEAFGQPCDALFVGSPTPEIDLVFQRLGTIVHECGHIYDIDLGGFSDSVYVIRPDLMISASGGDTTDRGGNTFARSLLLEDDYASLRPPCGSGDCDSYADVYLIGSGSEQGFNSVLEETTQYVNSLANEYAFADRNNPSARTSAKDGILTFLWYVERYLRLARTEYPSAYSFIIGDSNWRQVILTLWGRAWLFLELTRDTPGLGIDDDVLFPLVEDPELVAEIQAVRDAHGCAR